MASLVQAKEAEIIYFTEKKTEGKLERRRFSIKEILTLLILLPVFPVVFPLMMWIASYQERKLDELWEDERYGIAD